MFFQYLQLTREKNHDESSSHGLRALKHASSPACVCVWTYVQMCWREHASAIWISCLDRLWQLTQVEKEKGKHVNWHACKHTHTLHTHNSWMTMLSPWRRTLDPSGRMCCVTGCVYPPYPSNAEVLRAEYCWPMLNSQRRMRRMRCEPRQAQTHLKCQILGIRDRSVKTLSWLWLTLPCGRDWRGLSQEIGIHKGMCTSVLDWTFETQDCFDTTSVTLVFKALSKIWLIAVQPHSCKAWIWML